MAHLHLRREHPLGLAGAREVAQRWIDEGTTQFGLSCTLTPGEDRDVIHFSRTGVKGEVRVTADAFELNAKLGILLGAFKADIEREVGRVLDRMLAEASAGKKARRR